ncbi:MAG: hypothetical protein J1F60_02430 [Oscillospiraceae bacterium]|nr:hypothetical protein [Oscillospiraceae bacterium]
MQELTGQAIPPNIKAAPRPTVIETIPHSPVIEAPPLPPVTDPPYPLTSDREVRFFTSPKAVTRKTQLSITVFQLITAGTVCLLLKLCAIFSPELFSNLRRYLEHLFLW